MLQKTLSIQPELQFSSLAQTITMSYIVLVKAQDPNPTWQIRISKPNSPLSLFQSVLKYHCHKKPQKKALLIGGNFLKNKCILLFFPEQKCPSTISNLIGLDFVLPNDS